MAASTALHAAVVASVLLLLPSLLAPVAAQVKAKAFCISQFAIASQACSILPPSPPEEDHHRHHGDEDDDNGGGGDDDDDDDHGGDDGRRRRGRAAVSFSDLMAANDSHGAAGNVTTGHHGNRTRGGRGRGRRGRLRDDHGNDDDDHHGNDDDDHDDDDEDDDDEEDDGGHEHHDEELRAYRDCCRWLKEVQKECVCEALMRLPPFLVKPQHTYMVRVGKTCRITYRCGGV